MNIVLFCIVGELGSGKTLALTYLAWNNWIKKGKRIFSNYNLYGFPFTKINSIPDLDLMKEGFFAGDELWLYVDSWASKSEKTKIISSILLKSRKRDIIICYTSQTIGQVATRIRQVTDFISYPIMSLDNSYCRLEVFRAPNPSPASRIKPPIYFHTEPVFAMFSTREEVKPIDVEEKDKFKEIYLPITENPDWIRYLREQKGFDDLRIKKYSEMIEKMINPNSITSTKEMEETKT